jgi:plastocyanin
VIIGINNTVTWTNMDTTAHTVNSTLVPIGASAFGSGNLVAGMTFSHTFTQPGTYNYDCSYHPTWMKGTITVRAGP